MSQGVEEAPSKPVAGSTPAAAGPPRVLSTLNTDGSRRWLKPKLSSGRFLRARRVVAWLLILIFTALPYIKVGGRPLVLLNLPAREFTILGGTFYPTDTLLLALLVVGVFLTIFLVTALFGRVWCGWACPQTVYMEFLFRPIERFFDGAPGRAPKKWQSTALAKTLKFASYFAASCYLAHTFLAYFVGVDALRTWVTRSPLDHPVPFLVMATVTLLMLFDFTFFREQTCIVACPYGRMQSALLDRSSLIITYDARRGEPRGKARRPAKDLPLEQIPPTGDCVDCRMCVTTCPTGIDIRDGLQMECIGCAQCIDACDAVMTKLKRPVGLIRYSSQRAIVGEVARVFRARVLIYPAILLAVAIAFSFVLATRSDADVVILRGIGRPFLITSEGQVENPIRVKIMNRSREPRTYSVTVTSPEGLRAVFEDDRLQVEPGEIRTFPAIIVSDPATFASGSVRSTIRVEDGQEFQTDRTYVLVGPAGGRAPPGSGGAP